MAENVETTFQTLRGDLVNINRLMRILAEKLPKEGTKISVKDCTVDQAVKEAIEYGGYLAQHIKEAYGTLSDLRRPSSISLQLGGVVITWDVSS